MIISIIVATDSEGGIAKNGVIPWRCPQDLELFKRRTMGHFVIVGRNTWESMKSRLPGRNVIVLTRNVRYKSPKTAYCTAQSLEEALQIARSKGEREVFIIGGEQIYSEALGYADKIYVTRVTGNYSCDLFFPPMDYAAWKLHVEPAYPNECDFYVCIYSR